MMWDLDHEAVEGLPSGLCACRIGDTQMHIAALSPRSVWLRTQDEQLPVGALTLCLYRPETGKTEFHTPANVQTGPAQRSEDAVLTRFSFDDPACSAAIRRTLNSYARYLESNPAMVRPHMRRMPWAIPRNRTKYFCRISLPSAGHGSPPSLPCLNYRRKPNWPWS